MIVVDEKVMRLDMNRDTNELPGVIAELEDGYLTIQSNWYVAQSAFMVETNN